VQLVMWGPAEPTRHKQTANESQPKSTEVNH